jgi:hypothetical protein
MGELFAPRGPNPRNNAGEKIVSAKSPNMIEHESGKLTGGRATPQLAKKARSIFKASSPRVGCNAMNRRDRY